MFYRLAAIVFFVVGAAMSQAQELADPRVGEDLFGTYCWQCHGPDGRGTGPMAEMLAIATPDLTTLSTRNGGLFPVGKVAEMIDGRSPLLAHGGEMPIFGHALEASQSVALRLSSGQTMIVGLPLADLLAYIETLQTE